LLNLRLGVRHERAVVEWCEEALEALSSGVATSNITPIGEGREGKG
jgi:Virulence activator alpha C-term